MMERAIVVSNCTSALDSTLTGISLATASVLVVCSEQFEVHAHAAAHDAMPSRNSKARPCRSPFMRHARTCARNAS
jgi:hypothetical protein